MNVDLSLTPHSGLATGAVYQFVAGSWPGSIGDGLVLSEAAFDFVEPPFRRALPNWNELSRYGVTDLSPSDCVALVAELRAAARRVVESQASPEWTGYSGDAAPDDVRSAFDQDPERLDELATMFRGLADWLEAAKARSPSLMLLGI